MGGLRQDLAPVGTLEEIGRGDSNLLVEAEGGGKVRP